MWGQGVVVSRGTVLAVEAFEGTNAMLQRAGKFGAKNCLFVKLGKPKQDTRFDVPVFGLQTDHYQMNDFSELYLLYLAFKH